MSTVDREAHDVDRRLAGVTLLDVRTVARLLDISQREVWRKSGMARTGHSDFPQPLRFGPKTVRWRLSDLEAYVARHTGVPTS